MLVCRQRPRRPKWSSTSFSISRRASHTHVSTQIRRSSLNSRFQQLLYLPTKARKFKCIPSNQKQPFLVHFSNSIQYLESGIRKVYSSKKSVFVSLSAEGGVDSGQGSSVFSSDSPHLGQLTMSYSCTPSSQPPSQPQPQTPYPPTPSATPQQHPGYAQPLQPMVSGAFIQMSHYT